MGGAHRQANCYCPDRASPKSQHEESRAHEQAEAFGGVRVECVLPLALIVAPFTTL